ncbi:efflux transporter outer membrane subunit [Allosphingosinicella indica]|uniref:Efflux transporter, outer membrane factor (OMF) lipoprotein, NodT family n=1 Tax=Allosphingosinicella indica TaxID=941907 RepID=A0A1X7FY52_9SPHN|nr:efflux transporter outer membrane subunit [Allosphingosinicella indica]SMF60915.1 efflux transporter, outer membrane factor (OMF) lipoprotein, NodT family [Allosphingosinicella indica]
MIRTLLSSTAALALAACATGPDYAPPAVPTGAAGPFVSASAAVSPSPTANDRWWQLYRDPVLDGLIADALAANTDIRVAAARLMKARASLREVKGDRLPQVTAGASATYGRASAIQRPAGAAREDWTVDAGLDVAYEVDLFGRVSRGVEAARGDVAAAEADADAVRVAIVADTTRAYADAASAAERLAVAERIVALLDRSLKVTQRRAEVGMTTGLDTARVAALRNQRQAEVPAIAAERQAALFRLATLTGRTPAGLPPVAAARQETLRLDDPIPVGDGAALLARRPDVRAAERRLAAATARIGVATADLYPRITLGGSVGSTSSGLGNLFGAGPLNWLLGPLISWAVNPTQARARIAGAEADAQEALAAFDGIVLTALEETETGLSNYAKAIERWQALLAARDEAAIAARITRAQRREGQIDSLAQIDAERTFADAEAALALADAQISRSQIDLLKALGGRWTA